MIEVKFYDALVKNSNSLVISIGVGTRACH